MALVQVRDMPEPMYRLLVTQARKQRRSLAQQVVATLARGLETELDARQRRRTILEAIRDGGPLAGRRLSDPVKLVREDRGR